MSEHDESFAVLSDLLKAIDLSVFTSTYYNRPAIYKGLQPHIYISANGPRFRERLHAQPSVLVMVFTADRHANDQRKDVVTRFHHIL